MAAHCSPSERPFPNGSLGGAVIAKPHQGQSGSDASFLYADLQKRSVTRLASIVRATERTARFVVMSFVHGEVASSKSR